MTPWNFENINDKIQSRTKELMATYMYKESFKNFNMGYGSAVAGGMFILITLTSLITMRILNRKEE